jgi:hypothetical protein
MNDNFEPLEKPVKKVKNSKSKKEPPIFELINEQFEKIVKEILELENLLFKSGIMNLNVVDNFENQYNDEPEKLIIGEQIKLDISEKKPSEKKAVKPRVKKVKEIKE